MNAEQALRLQGMADAAGVEFFDYQTACFEEVLKGRAGYTRLCLYYKTGSGKSLTALVCLALEHYTEALIIAPPSTHSTWMAQAEELGMKVQTMSHAKFRMKTTRLSKTTAVIADEMHLFGGHQGQGWKKLDALARGLQAPLVLASATPSYNDAERVYCVQHVLDPHSCKGGFLEFLYQNCSTEQNPFSQTPIVKGFLNYPTAADYLSDLPGVMYLKDDLSYTINDYALAEKIPQELSRFGYNRRAGKMIASQMEMRHARINLSLVHDNDEIRQEVLSYVLAHIDAAVGSVLIFSQHSTVAVALSQSLDRLKIEHGLVTGLTGAKNKQFSLDAFRTGLIPVLIGTASLATGTDGLDKVCDTLVIVDDTDDNSLRRQLIGRIMPRGKATTASHKQVHRLVLQ